MFATSRPVSPKVSRISHTGIVPPHWLAVWMQGCRGTELMVKGSTSSAWLCTTALISGFAS